MAVDLIGVARAIVFIIIGQVVLYTGYRALIRLSAITKTMLNERILKSSRRLISLTIILGGLYLAVPSLGLPYYSDELREGLRYVAFILITFVASRVVSIALDEALGKIGVPEERRSITVNVVRVSILVLGSLAIASYYLQVVVPFAVSLGIFGFALTFSLQYPLANFVGWLYIMSSKEIRVGDGVQIGGNGGTVLSIDYLTTKIVELDEYGRPSGRLLTIPNSTVLTSNVSTWVNPPFIWDSISFMLAYGSDIEYARDVMLKTVNSILEGEKLGSASQAMKDFYEEIGYKSTEADIGPHVLFEPAGGGWIAAKLMYLIPRPERLRIRTLVTERTFSAFEAEPERVKFPPRKSP